MEEVCSGLSLEDPTLRYYFQKYPLLEQTGFTCLARLMIFSFVNLSESDPDRSFQVLCDTWERLRRDGYYFIRCSEYGLSLYTLSDSELMPFAHGLWQLSLPLPFKERLMEVFSDFPAHPLRRMTCSKRTLWCKTPILTQFYVSVGWSH